MLETREQSPTAPITVTIVPTVDASGTTHGAASALSIGGGLLGNIDGVGQLAHEESRDIAASSGQAIAGRSVVVSADSSDRVLAAMKSPEKARGQDMG
ncbi:hypothetical protein PO002_42130 [Cupriavidus necator]|uniref:hypothetical protein n=1 Tax=Cupriavidus necator TaxID=106590 RepID=UPI0039C13A96